MRDLRVFRCLVLGVLVLGVYALTPRCVYAGDPAAARKGSSSSTSSGGVKGFSWTGPYVGMNLGYGWGNADTTFTPLPSATQFVNLAPTTLHPGPNGIVGGGQFGYNWQRGRWVLGAEADISGSAMAATAQLSPIVQNDGTPFPGTGNHLFAHQETSWYATVRPRVGWTPGDRLLVYGTGGLAVGHVTFSADADFRPTGTEHYPIAFDDTKAGWVAGAGVELAFTHHWSVKGEFLHYDLGSETLTANPAIPLPPFQVRYHWDTTANVARLGVNFRF